MEMTYWVPILAVAITAFLVYLAGSIRRCIYPPNEYIDKIQPPGWVFSVVWPILFILLAWAGEKIWNVRDVTGTTGSPGRRIAFFLLLFTLILWPIIHWRFCSPVFSLIIIIFSLMLGIALLIVMIPKDKLYIESGLYKVPSALLLLPLILWLGFASIINWRTAIVYG